MRWLYTPILFLFLTSNIFAYDCDVDGDGKEGLAEAIHALQLVSGQFSGALGDPCDIGSDCGSGYCVDGVCCNSACNLPNTASSGCIGGECQIDICASHYANCNGVESDGCETDLGYYVSDDDNRVENSCATAISMAISVCGDESGDISISSRGTKWIKFRADECSSSDTNLSVAVNLSSLEGGAQYDLLVAEGSCTASLDGKGVCSWNCVDDGWSDDWGDDDDKWIYVLVHHVSGNPCEDWTLRVQGYAHCVCE